MRPPLVVHAGRFLPVGHGLFHAGRIIVPGNRGPEFTYAYDCGTLSALKYLERAVDVVLNETSTKELHLLVLSHLHDVLITILGLELVSSEGLAARLLQSEVGDPVAAVAPMLGLARTSRCAADGRLADLGGKMVAYGGSPSSWRRQSHLRGRRPAGAAPRFPPQLVQGAR